MRKNKYFEKTSRRIRRNINKLFDSHCIDGKEIVLFGLVRETPLIMECIMARNAAGVSALIDNSPNKIGGYFSGIRIDSPESCLLPYKKNIVVLICSSVFYQEQALQLEELGYRRNIGFIEINIPLQLPMILKELTEIRKIMFGYLLYKRLMRGRNTACKMIFCPYAGSGDTYLIGMYLSEYVQKNHLENYIVVANGSLVRKVLDLFGIDVDEIVNQDQSDNLLAAYQFFDRNLVKIKPLLFWGWRARKRINVFYDTSEISVTFIDDFKYDVFELDKSVKGILPVFKTSKDDVDSFFKKHGLIPGKTVILAPYLGADLGAEIPMLVWERLAKALTGLGYCVCTNSASEDETPVSGTKPLFFPYRDSVRILDAAGYFIGLRSGLCDIISSSVCKMIIFYINAVNIIPKHYFSLQAMGLNDAAIELEYNGTDDEAFVARILAEF